MKLYLFRRKAFHLYSHCRYSHTRSEISENSNLVHRLNRLEETLGQSVREDGNAVDSLFSDEIQGCTESAVNLRFYLTYAVDKLAVKADTLSQADSADSIRSHELFVSCKAENIRSQSFQIDFTGSRCLRSVAYHHKFMPPCYGPDNFHIVYVARNIGAVGYHNKPCILFYDSLNILIFQPSVAVHSYVSDLSPLSCKVIENRNRGAFLHHRGNHMVSRPDKTSEHNIHGLKLIVGKNNVLRIFHVEKFRKLCLCNFCIGRLCCFYTFRFHCRGICVVKKNHSFTFILSFMRCVIL